MRQESGFPGRLTGFMEFVDKFHEKAVVQFFQILNAQTTSFTILTHTFPSYEAIGAVTLLFASPGRHAILHRATRVLLSEAGWRTYSRQGDSRKQHS